MASSVRFADGRRACYRIDRTALLLRWAGVMLLIAAFTLGVATWFGLGVQWWLVAVVGGLLVDLGAKRRLRRAVETLGDRALEVDCRAGLWANLMRRFFEPTDRDERQVGRLEARAGSGSTGRSGRGPPPASACCPPTPLHGRLPRSCCCPVAQKRGRTPVVEYIGDEY